MFFGWFGRKKKNEKSRSGEVRPLRRTIPAQDLQG